MGLGAQEPSSVVRSVGSAVASTVVRSVGSAMEGDPVGCVPVRRGCGSDADYAALVAKARVLSAADSAPEGLLAPLCDALWDALSSKGLSWVGFYLADLGADRALDGTSGGLAVREMILAARRDKPACSPIGLQGVCGQGLLEQRIRLVEDVALLGDGYIACDPRDRSEIVVPIYRNGRIWGVLDADSHELACFGQSDVQGLVSVLRAAGLLDRELQVRADRLHDPRGSL
jgi:putative methionine-R-sulfoxide reductase with GAF domain